MGLAAQAAWGQVLRFSVRMAPMAMPVTAAPAVMELRQALAAAVVLGVLVVLLQALVTAVTGEMAAAALRMLII